MVTHPEWRMLGGFAESWVVAADRVRLVNDPVPEVRAIVAYGPLLYRTTVEPLLDEAYARLLADPDASVRESAAEYSIVPHRILVEYADHADVGVRRQVCRPGRNSPRMSVTSCSPTPMPPCGGPPPCGPAGATRPVATNSSPSSRTSSATPS
ncbi:hypothetical protein [Streptomyces adelaidensis]|uniref:hypothetical protein n=1 Tax=Streptomyces adelaidensis TaxID=2796465 RepID=UPI001907EBB3|nr:hypothetical protein [Streptomyces adelaidensis]